MLDGRTQDFRVGFGDGKAKRPVMIVLVDVATNAVIGWELATSENAVSTVRLIRTACATFGVFDRLCTDNGAAFAGHLVAGAAVYSFRRRGHRGEGVKPPGICVNLGIDLRFALPANGQAKIAERPFATLSRVIDDAPEFAGAHAGDAPAAAPDSSVVPAPVDMARRVIEREINRHNAEPRAAQSGCQGAFLRAGLQGRADGAGAADGASDVPCGVDPYGGHAGPLWAGEDWRADLWRPADAGSPVAVSKAGASCWGAIPTISGNRHWPVTTRAT